MAFAYPQTLSLQVGLGSDYTETCDADSPIAAWRLGERSGSTAEDSVGAADGTHVGTVTVGVVGALPETDPAAQYDGATAYTNMGNVAALNISGNFTLEAWGATTDGTNAPIMLGKYDGTRGYVFFLEAGHPRLILKKADGSTIVDTQTTETYVDNLYHHFVATYDGANAKIYVDGALVKTTAATGTPNATTGAFNLSNFNNTATPNNNLWLGRLDEIRVYFTALSAARILAHYNAGAWTDITTDWNLSTPCRFYRGQAAGAAPTDRTARPGLFSFVLRNDTGTAGGVLGYYSPNNTNVRSGWRTGIPVRLMVRTTALVWYTLWTGRVRTIRPEPGVKRSRQVYCTAQDLFADLSEAAVREIAAQSNQSEDALIQAVIDALPTQALPGAVDLDVGLDSYTYALNNVGAGAQAVGLLNDIAVSALGQVYARADGTLVYTNRQTRIATTSSYTFGADTDGDALEVPDALDGIYNRVRVTIHPKTITASTLYASTAAIAVGPGQTLTVWGTYRDANNPDRLIGGTNFTDPLVSGTDFIGNSAADGSGTVRTSSLSVAVTPFATTAKFEITNSYTDVVYATTLQLRGDGIFDNAPQVFESFVPMTYGDRPLDLDLAFQDDPNVAQDLADYQAGLLSQPVQVRSASFHATRSSALLTQALTREIGDVITLSETVTGVSAVDCQILGVDITLGINLFRVTWNLGPQSTVSALILDDPVFGVLDAPEAVLGYA